MIDQGRFIREFGPHILHFQAKDVMIDRDGLYERGSLSGGIGWQVPRIPGLGDAPWAEIFSDALPRRLRWPHHHRARGQGLRGQRREGQARLPRGARPCCARSSGEPTSVTRQRDRIDGTRCLVRRGARRSWSASATSQAEAIEAAAQLCADTIAADGLVHLFGTGHSRIPVEEMFPRYGSFPGFHPIVELSMTYHTEVVGSNGQRQAMFIERMPGLAEVILDNFSFGAARRDDGLLRQRPDRGARSRWPAARAGAA